MDGRLLYGLGTCLGGALLTVFAYRFSRLTEQTDAIGSNRSLGEVEPADWRVLGTRFLGVLVVFVGSVLLAGVDLRATGASLLTGGVLVTGFADRLSRAQRRLNGVSDPTSDTWTVVLYRLVGGVAALVGLVMVGSALLS